MSHWSRKIRKCAHLWNNIQGKSRQPTLFALKNKLYKCGRLMCHLFMSFTFLALLCWDIFMEQLRLLFLKVSHRLKKFTMGNMSQRYGLTVSQIIFLKKLPSPLTLKWSSVRSNELLYTWLKSKEPGGMVKVWRTKGLWEAGLWEYIGCADVASPRLLGMGLPGSRRRRWN